MKSYKQAKLNTPEVESSTEINGDNEDNKLEGSTLTEQQQAIMEYIDKQEQKLGTLV